MAAIKSGNELVNKLGTILGLPEHTTAFSLRCAVNEIVTIQCEYYPTLDLDEDGELITEFKRFQLEEIDALQQIK